jgi:copper chaperone
MATSTRYTVAGMTCGHCVAAVTEEIWKIDGVEQVAVDLVAGGQSTVTVTSDAPLAENAVREAVDEAGYALTGVSG